MDFLALDYLLIQLSIKYVISQFIDFRRAARNRSDAFLRLESKKERRNRGGQGLEKTMFYFLRKS